jgi:3-deoxy-manno-octulosonate cytidylyltransferase (CMP-KDO synthetase)
MTPPELPSGTDRCAYIAKDTDFDIVVNIQGDEPFLHSESHRPWLFKPD